MQRVSLSLWQISGKDIALALVVTALSTVIAIMSEGVLGLTSSALILVMGVMVVALQTPRPLALFSAIVSFLAYDYVLVDPRGSFTITTPEEILAVTMFLFAALVVEHLAGKVRAQVRALRIANAHASAVSELGRRLSSAVDARAAYAATASALRDALSVDIVVVSGELCALRVSHSVPPEVLLEPVDLDNAALVLSAPRPQVVDNPAGKWSFVACSADVAVGIRYRANSAQGDVARALASAMLDDLAQTLERIRLASELEAARVRGETERLRAALLSSVSHDLRSPLSAMIGGVTSLSEYDRSLSADNRRVLLESILQEGRRLDGYIQNLLDMTRLEHGGLSLTRDWIGADDIVGAAVSRLRKLDPEARVDVFLEPDLPLLKVQPALIEQAVFNLLENAAKFSPQNARIGVSAYRTGDSVAVDVQDAGPGVPAEERERIFDMFYSVARGDRSGPGTGLGLPICRGMVDAHGGSVEALAPPGGVGTLMRIRLPLESAPAPESDDT